MPNPRNRARRRRLFALVFVILAITAVFSLSRPWYVATMTDATVMGVSGVNAHVTLTGSQLASLAPTTSQGVALGNQNPSVSKHFGLMDPVFYLCVAAGLGALCALRGARTAGVTGFIASFYAWQSLLSVRAQVENSRTWGSFTVVRGSGQSLLWLCMTVAILSLGLVTVQAFLAHHQTKLQGTTEAPERDSGSVAERIGFGALLASLAASGLRAAASRLHDGPIPHEDLTVSASTPVASTPAP
jgi:hypothetical protein